MKCEQNLLILYVTYLLDWPDICKEKEMKKEKDFRAFDCYDLYRNAN